MSGAVVAQIGRSGGVRRSRCVGRKKRNLRRTAGVAGRCDGSPTRIPRPRTLSLDVEPQGERLARLLDETSTAGHEAGCSMSGLKGVGLAIYCADIGSIGNDNFGWAVVDGDGQRGGNGDRRVGRRGGRLLGCGSQGRAWIRVSPVGAGAGRPFGVDGRTRGGRQQGMVGGRGCQRIGGGTDGDRLDPAPDQSGPARQACVAAVRVSGVARIRQGGHGQEDGHVADALTACCEFAARLPDPGQACASEPSHAARSLIGAAVLWSGWSADMDLLRARCLVVKSAGPAT